MAQAPTAALSPGSCIVCLIVVFNSLGRVRFAHGFSHDMVQLVWFSLCSRLPRCARPLSLPGVSAHVVVLALCVALRVPSSSGRLGYWLRWMQGPFWCNQGGLVTGYGGYEDPFGITRVAGYWLRWLGGPSGATRKGRLLALWGCIL